MRIIILAVLCGCRLIACTCSPLTVCELVKQPVIFIGQVIEGGIESLREDPWHSRATHARFKVLERFRGLPAGAETVDVQLLFIPGMCSPIPYYLGNTYLVTPRWLNGTLTDGGCTSARDVERDGADVHYLREYFAGRMPANIHGRIAATGHDSDLVDFLLNMGEAKQLAGVQVTATHRNKTYSALTGSDGKYFLALPGPGYYTIRASLRSYFEAEEELSIAAHDCEVRNFALSTDNTISGTLWDERGQPVPEATLGLIDIDHPHDRSINHAWFDHAYSGKVDGSFTFEHVPVGRYLLAFNPDGPQSGALVERRPRSLFDSRFETTYYPLSSTRDQAQIINIQSNHIHLNRMDVVIGGHVEFRQVNIIVRFSDGTPMRTAKLEVAGEPLRSEDIVWHPRRPLGTTFQAPANRTLRIEVKDEFGRHLNAIYSAIYEPGTTSITHEFVISP